MAADRLDHRSFSALPVEKEVFEQRAR